MNFLLSRTSVLTGQIQVTTSLLPCALAQIWCEATNFSSYICIYSLYMREGYFKILTFAGYWRSAEAYVSICGRDQFIKCHLRLRPQGASLHSLIFDVKLEERTDGRPGCLTNVYRSVCMHVPLRHVSCQSLFVFVMPRNQNNPFGRLQTSRQMHGEGDIGILYSFYPIYNAYFNVLLFSTWEDFAMQVLRFLKEGKVNFYTAI